MQINSVVNSQIVPEKQNFKGSSANSSPFSSFPSYQQIPLETSKAYASPQITQGYKEIETFDVPYVGKGKLYELANGHKVIIVPKASKTYISTLVGVGFSDEPAENKNIAHLSEHLLANYWHKASSTSDINKILKETAASPNASTVDTSTRYYMSANVQDSNDLENLIKIQLGTLTNNKFSEKEIQKEKKMVVEEVKENGYFTKEETTAYNQTKSNLFNLANSNGFVAETTMQKIDAIKKEDLEKFYNNFYRPDNMTTVVVGNVDNESIKTISKYLNKMTNTKSELQRENISTIKEGQYINTFKRTDMESLDKSNEFWHFTELSFVGPKTNNSKDTEIIIILNKIIQNRLKQQKIEINAGLPSVSSDKTIPQVIDITGSSRKVDVENNIKTIYSTIDDLVKNQISKDELEKAREQVLESMTGYLEDNKLLASFLNDMLLSDQKMNVKSLFNHLKNISSSDIQDVAKKYLDLNKASLVVVSPNKSATKSADVSFTGLSELTNTKDIKEYDLPNNLHVIFDSRAGIVKTAVSCQFSFEDKQKNNSGMLDAMQTSLIRNENNEWPAGNWIGQDGILIRKSASLDDLQSILNNLKNELINPEFNSHELDVSKKLQKEIAQQAKIIYPRDLLEGSNFPQKESEICPDWVSTNDLKAYHHTMLKNSQGTIIITIPKEKLEQSEPELIKSLSEFPTVRPHNFTKISSEDEPKDLEKNSIFLDKNETSEKIQIIKTFKVIDKGSVKDEATVRLLSAILNENLEKSLSEDLGLTYSAYSTFEKFSPKHGILSMSTEIAKAPLKDSTKTALIQIDNIINQLATKEVDEPILNSTKKQIKSNLLIPAETSVDRNMGLESLYRMSYDIKHSQKLAEAIDNITPADLQNLAHKYLTKPSVLEISGNKKAIEANKEYLAKLGEISTNN